MMLQLWHYLSEMIEECKLLVCVLVTFPITMIKFTKGTFLRDRVFFFLHVAVHHGREVTETET